MAKNFYKKQQKLIEIALDILAKEMPKYKEEYGELFYSKNIPPHIKQPLIALKNKIFFKPIYKKIEKNLNISSREAKKLVEEYGFTYVLNNLEKFKK